MSNLSLILPDGNSIEIEQGQPYAEAVRQIGEGLLRNALAVTIDGVHHPLDEASTVGGQMQVITKNSPEGLNRAGTYGNRHRVRAVIASDTERRVKTRRASNEDEYHGNLTPGVKFNRGVA